MSLINCLLPTKSATVQTLGHPAAGVVGWLEGQPTDSGVVVNADTALTLSAIWCATRIIAETVGTLPCIMYKRKGKDERDRARNDPRYNLVRNAPHPEMNAISFFETQTSAMVLQGNCYARMRRNGMRDVAQFEIRAPGTVRTEIEGDRVSYNVSDPPEKVGSENMLHVAGLGGNGINGWSVVRYGAQSIGSGMATDNYVASVYANRATPNGAITTPLRMDKPARDALRKDWEKVHGGSGNAAKVAILHGGMTYQNVSMTPEDVELIASRNFGVREVARWFRLPPHMLADLENSSVRANIEQQAIEFVVYSLSPWLVRWQQTLNRKLLTPQEQKRYYFEFLLDALLRGDVGSRYAAYAQGIQWGWLSINDIRKKENMPLVEGGDDYLQPANMNVVGGEPEEQPMQMPQPPEQEEQVPQSLAKELSNNLSQSFGCIMDEAKELRKTLLSGQRESEDAFCKTLGNLRELRDEIRGDMDAEPKTQVRGFEAERAQLTETCDKLFRSSLRYVLSFEKSAVTRAVNRMVSRKENFIGWVEEFYSKQSDKIVEKIAEPAECYRSLNGDEDVDIARWHADKIAEQHKFDLIDACDGDREGVVDRIKAVCDNWENEIEHATMCVEE